MNDGMIYSALLLYFSAAHYHYEKKIDTNF